MSPTKCFAGLSWVFFLTTAFTLSDSAAMGQAPPAGKKSFRAGAYAIDITPTKFPVIVSGYFEERTANRAQDTLHARCLVLDDGTTRIALVVVDSLMMPRELLDSVKKMAQETTGIPTDRILISATHTHSAPSVMGALGSRSDPEYAAFLVPQLVRGIHLAAKGLRPAQVGWAVVQDFDHTFNRRWIRRPDRLIKDPFGNPTGRANMHPGHQNPDAIGPSGPVDPDLSLVAIRTPEGQPLALLANYSMHYYGSAPVSADYYGRFADEIRKRIGAEKGEPAFVGIMSQGTSGDLMWMNYGQPRNDVGTNRYAEAVAARAFEAYQKVRYQDWVPLAMRETTLKLNRRVPDEKRLAWARETAAKIKGPLPRGHAEIYAKEQIYLHEEPQRELKLQAVRIGDLGITAIPNEVFALTGLKLKAMSPLQPTFNIELANGGEGYIPPPEQHKLGGYTTWPARTAGLEETAEPKIVEALLKLLEEVAGKPRLQPAEEQGAYPKAVLASKPTAYWRLADMAGRSAADATGQHAATFEDGFAFHLDGPPNANFSGHRTINRAVHFAGGRMKATPRDLGDTYSVEMWFWNGLPLDARAVTGYLFSRGSDGDAEAVGDHLGIGGAKMAEGRMLFFNGNQRNQTLSGTTEIKPRTWHHVVLVREGGKVSVYLDGNPEIRGEAASTTKGGNPLFFGGRCDRFANWEGKLDEIAVYPRALSAEEVAQHYQASGMPRASAAPVGPVPAEQALKLFRAAPGLRVELVAAEPDVQSPVAMAFDADGRLWVVEMLDYPNGPAPGQPPEGRIKVLEDRDGTGRYRTARVFADHLLFANGILPWNGGMLVTAAPAIWFLQDTDGDGKADRREKWYEGFATQNPQLRVSHPLLGLDNWIHVANGLRGGKVKRSGGDGKTIIDISGRDFRFDPIRGRAEAITGMGQYGNTFDDWGKRFVCTNRHHWVHLVMPERYVRRNPYLAIPEQPRDNQGPGGAARIYPLSRQVTTFAEHFGSFSAACGVFVYRGSLLPESFRGAIFTCDPTGNLVHQEVLMPRDASFTGRPAQIGVEFLATPDDWCRPVFLTHGPDGAMYVVDMYRKVIEHPEWMPPADRTRTDLNEGKDRGRIWRIVPDQPAAAREKPQLSKASSLDLVKRLEDTDAWWRTTAQRLLLERRDPQADEPLRQMVVTSPSALAQVHAAWLLEARGQLTPDQVLPLLRHENARVREQGILLAERWLPRSEPVQERVLALAGDPDPQVRFQAALSLGEWDDSRILASLARIATAGAEDRWTRLAVASSVPRRAGALLALLLQSASGLGREATTDRLALVQELAAVAGGRQDPTEVADLLETLLGVTGRDAGAWQMAGRKGLAEGMQRRGVQLAVFLRQLPPERRKLVDQLDALTSKTIALAREGVGKAPQRVEAVQLLASLDWKTAEPVLRPLVASEPAAEVRVAAVRALAAFAQPEVGSLLIQSWKTQPTAGQREVLEALLSRPDRILLLLQEMEAGRIQAAELDSLRRVQLLSHRRSDIRERARRLFATAATPERKAIVEKFRPALSLAGDPRRGRDVFHKATCATCHRIGTLGIEVGPDIADTRTRGPDALLADILDPNAAIDANYINYVVTLKNGKVLTGMLAGETASSIALRRAERQTDVVLRQDIEADGLLASGKSLMPEGLEKDLSLQDMADLLAFLRHWRELEKTASASPGN